MSQGFELDETEYYIESERTNLVRFPSQGKPVKHKGKKTPSHLAHTATKSKQEERK